MKSFIISSNCAKEAQSINSVRLPWSAYDEEFCGWRWIELNISIVRWCKEVINIISTFLKLNIQLIINIIELWILVGYNEENPEWREIHWLIIVSVSQLSYFIPHFLAFTIYSRIRTVLKSLLIFDCPFVASIKQEIMLQFEILMKR